MCKWAVKSTLIEAVLTSLKIKIKLKIINKSNKSHVQLKSQKKPNKHRHVDLTSKKKYKNSSKMF